MVELKLLDSFVTEIDEIVQKGVGFVFFSVSLVFVLWLLQILKFAFPCLQNIFIFFLKLWKHQNLE